MDNIEKEIKELIIENLNLEDLTTDQIVSTEALFGTGLGLDSIDALELGVALQKKYNIKIDSKSDEVKKHFYSVETIAQFVSQKVGGSNNGKS